MIDLTIVLVLMTVILNVFFFMFFLLLLLSLVYDCFEGNISFASNRNCVNGVSALESIVDTGQATPFLRATSCCFDDH